MDRAGLVGFVLGGGVDPHPLLDVEHYARQAPGVVDAIGHYRHAGAAAGLDPHPLFETRFYLAQCPEALGPGVDPLSHYLAAGWRAGLDPHPLFSTTYYRQRNPDVAAAGVNPLMHYVLGGRRENRETTPWFDAGDYLRRYPDVAASGLPALLHFVLYGAGERRIGGPLLAFRIGRAPEYDRAWGAIDLVREEWDSYLAWVRVTARVPEEWRARAMAGLGVRPVVSLLVHVGRGIGGMAATIRSVRGQVYGDWELCIAMGPSLGTAERGVLAGWAAEDARIVVVEGREDVGLGLNAGLRGARGAYAGVLVAGDRLHGLALAALAGGLQGGAAVVYGDEDRVDGAGFHVDPVFKPDWSPELLLGMDYVSGACLVRTSLLRRVGGFRAGFGGAAGYELMLRLLGRKLGGSVAHVARPLFHRGDAGGDDAGMRRALDAHLDGRGVAVALGPGRFRVGFMPAPGREALVSVVIPTGNGSFAGPLGREWVLDNCLRSLRRGTGWGSLEIVVVHDGNLSARQLGGMGGVVLVEDGGEGFNFSRKVNLGVAASRGEYVLLLNDDVEGKGADWLRHLVGAVQQDGVGVAGAKLFFPDGRLQHTGIVVQHGNPGHLYYRADGEEPGYLGMNEMLRTWLAVTGACQLVRRDVFDAVGGYDEGLPLNFNDVDFCLRVGERGLRSVYVPQAELYHFEGATRAAAGQGVGPEEAAYFQARWGGRYPVDPYYHPDLPSWAPLGVRGVDEVRGTASQARRVRGRRKGVLGVNWMGPVNRSSGLGTASRGYVAALQTAGLRTRLVDLDRIFPHQAEVGHSFASTARDYPVTLVHSNADTTGLVLEHYGEAFGRAGYRIGVWVWELPAARPEWREAMRRYDEIWVPSTFCATAFRAISDVPVTVVPYALQGLPRFGAGARAGVRASLGVGPGVFMFLYMFDTYSFVERKNPLALLDAFEAAFGCDGRAVLVLKISYFGNRDAGYSGGNEALLARIEAVLAHSGNVRVITEILAPAAVYGLIDAADCYVSPHRSEGFGLTVAEAMHYGRVVIATDFGGTTDFVREGVGLPLRYRLVELEEDRGPYRRGNVWAEPSVEHLVELMLRVVGDGALCGMLGLAGRALVRRRFSAGFVGRIARERLGAILGG